MQSFNEILKDVEIKNKEYVKLCELLEYEEVLQDKKLFLHLEKQKNMLNPLIESYAEYLQIEKLIKEINSVLSIQNEEKLLFENELKLQQEQLMNLQEKIKKEYLLLQSKEEKITIEIIKNKDEISNKLFEILIEGYCNICSSNNLSFVVEKQKMVATINISGYNAKSYFDCEIGTHLASLGLLQGICRVFVYDNINIDDYDFSEDELQITACRSSGAGGQHINKTESSIKITHLPTGISAVSQDERSQFQNKQKALFRLKEKVENYTQKQKKLQIENQKKQQLNLLKTIVKNYDLENQKINKNGSIFLLKDFLQGNNS